MMFSSTAEAFDAAAAATAPGGSRLELAFERSPGGTTFIASQFAEYPYHVCRPLFLDRELPGLATLYLQSCSGGLFEDDKLACDVIAGTGSAVHLTSGASTIVHSSRRGGQAEHSTAIRAEQNAFAEYLPDPVILFPHARLTTRLDLTLDPSATIIVSDSFIVHDPAGLGGVPAFIAMTVTAKLADGTLLARDRIAISGEAFKPGKPGVMGPWKCYGTVMVLTRNVPSAALRDGLRGALAGIEAVYAGVSTLPNRAGVWARFLTADAVSLRGAIARAWMESRRLLIGHEPVKRPK